MVLQGEFHRDIPVEEILAAEVVPAVFLPVHPDAGNVRVVLVRGGRQQRQRPFRVLERHFPEHGRADDEDVLSVRDGVEAQGAHHIPGRHLAGVVVPAQAGGTGVVLGVQHVAYLLLALPGFPRVIIHIDDVVHRLVGMGILSQVAELVRVGGDVGLLSGGRREEEGVERPGEGLASAHQFHEPVHVVRDEERVLVAVPFAEVRDLAVSAVVERVEAGPPGAVGVPAAHEAGLRVEDVAEPAGVPHVFPVVFFLAEHPRHLGDAPVVVTVFQRLGRCVRFQVTRNVAVLAVVFRTAEFPAEEAEGIALGGDFHRFQ